MSKIKSLSRLTPLIVFAIIATFLAIGLTKDPSKLPSNLIDRPLPQFGLPSLTQPETLLTASDLGRGVTLLNIFGSWCQACLIEHPTLLRLKAREDFDLIGINWRDTRQDASRWLAEYGDPYDQIIFDANSDLSIELGVTGAPETFIVGPGGRIRYKHVGPITETVFLETIAPIISALNVEAGS